VLGYSKGGKAHIPASGGFAARTRLTIRSGPATRPCLPLLPNPIGRPNPIIRAGLTIRACLTAGAGLIIAVLPAVAAPARPAHEDHLNFQIGEQDLKTPTREFRNLIRQAPGFALGQCALGIKRLQLADWSTQGFYAATTRDGCGWDIANGPIWIVEISRTGMMQLILNGSGAGLAVQKGTHNGLRDLILYDGNAGIRNARGWNYDGTKYTPATNAH
jgi:hypothetical protein